MSSLIIVIKCLFSEEYLCYYWCLSHAIILITKLTDGIFQLLNNSGTVTPIPGAKKGKIMKIGLHSLENVKRFLKIANWLIINFFIFSQFKY
jgi:hypothetical protein